MDGTIDAYIAYVKILYNNIANPRVNPPWVGVSDGLGPG